MDRISLSVESRTATGKGPSRRLRAAGKLPAIFYGGKTEPIRLSLDNHEFVTSYGRAGANPLFDLTIDTDGKVEKRLAILKERQSRPLTGEILHLDFIEIFMDQAIEVTIPVEYDGKPVGVDKGGLFQASTREVRVSCLPDNIPNSFVVDVSGLDVGDSLHVGSIDLPEGVEMIEDETLTLASVVVPSRPEEAEAEKGEEVEGEVAEGAETEAEAEEE